MQPLTSHKMVLLQVDYLTWQWSDNIQHFSDMVDQQIATAHGERLALLPAISCCWEDYLPATYYPMFLEMIDIIKRKGIDRYLIILDHHMMEKGETLDDDNVMYVNFSALRCYKEIFIDGHPHNQAWSSTASRALCLTGTSQKLHRVGLISRLYDQGLLHRFVHSFFMWPGVESICRGIVPHYDDAQWQRFLADCLHTPDALPISDDGEPRTNHAGYDVDLYAGTLFSLISETWIAPGHSTFVTEKTWRAISNNHPFIMVGCPNTLAKLRTMGYRTFEHYLSVPEYDTDTNEYQRLDLAIHNAANWLDHIRDHEDEIRHDTLHNHDLFRRHMAAHVCDIDIVLHALGGKQQGFDALFLIDAWNNGWTHPSS